MIQREEEDLRYLFDLARDKSVEGRRALAATVSDLFFGKEGVLTDNERALMADILRQLIHDVEMSVRRSLAERLAEQPDAPHELIVTLANDQIEVAHPILLKSEVLQDNELIEIIRHRTMEHQLVIAAREKVSEVVSDALVETGNEDVIKALIENPSARISQGTMEYLVEQSKRVDKYQNPLVRRPDLGPGLAGRMYWWVSAALRKNILENYEIDPTELDDHIETSVKDAIAKMAEHERRKSFQLADRLAEAQEITPKLLIQVLRQGEIPLFEALLMKLTNLRETLVRRIMFEPGGEGLAIACKAMGIEKPDFASIFLLSRKTRPGDKTVDPRELSRVLGLFDRMTRSTAEKVLKRWQRDPQYLDSIRRLEEPVERKPDA